MPVHNPLCEAVQLQDCLFDIHGHMMFEIAGDAAFEPFDDELNMAVMDLIDRASNAVTHLSHRARHARLNAIWRDFVIEQKRQRVHVPEIKL